MFRTKIFRTWAFLDTNKTSDNHITSGTPFFRRGIKKSKLVLYIYIYIYMSFYFGHDFLGFVSLVGRHAFSALTAAFYEAFGRLKKWRFIKDGIWDVLSQIFNLTVEYVENISFWNLTFDNINAFLKGNSPYTHSTKELIFMSKKKTLDGKIFLFFVYFEDFCNGMAHIELIQSKNLVCVEKLVLIKIKLGKYLF